MNRILNAEFPYLMKFFKTALAHNRLFHSIILHGSGSFMQYAIALELARQLNCEKDGSDECACRNCRWIRENKHPAVMTVSKIDNKPSGDKTRTVISVQQTQMVLDSVFSPSEYKKVFIFCDADIKKPADDENAEYKKFKETGYCSPQEEAEGRLWLPMPLNRNCFQEESANSMLKSIEEPPSGVTFIFLTDSPDDLISTIVSRSQAFYAPSVRIKNYPSDFFKGYFAQYPYFNPENTLDFVQALIKYQTENELDGSFIIDCLQHYLINMLKSSAGNQILTSKLMRDTAMLDEAKKMLKSYVKEQQVYEHAAFHFAGKISTMQPGTCFLNAGNLNCIDL